MKRCLAALALLGVFTGCAVRPDSLAVGVPTVDALPVAWRPPPNLRRTLGDAPWTDEEAAHARRAARAGVEEMAAYFAAHPEAVTELGGNAVECFLNVTYAAMSQPALRERAGAKARRQLRELVAPWTPRTVDSNEESDFIDTVTLAVYARQLLGPEHPPTRHLVALANAAVDRCGSLRTALGLDWSAVLARDPVPNAEAYELLLALVTLIDARTVPGLRLPDGSRDFAKRVWAMLRDYPLVGAGNYVAGANDETFYDTAYLATHIGYVPTGYGRHALRIADSPGLYLFLRENFYPVLEMGELDLVAEFVDLLRQYGATEETDIQVRHGTRHLLHLLETAGGWMNHRESYETTESNPYDLIHKPWTGVAGVRRRVPEPAAPGTYGASFTEWCTSP